MNGTAAAAGPLAGVELTGDLACPVRLTVPDLQAWPQHRIRVSFACATSGVQHHHSRVRCCTTYWRPPDPASTRPATGTGYAS